MVEISESKGKGISLDVAAKTTDDSQPWSSTPQLSTASEAVVANPEWQATEKQLVRKLDMTLLPMVFLLYMFNYLDRNNIAQAKLNHFERDIGLMGNEFNTALAIFHSGYMLAQLPSNMILTRIRPSVYIPCCVMLWSIVSASTAAARGFGSLVAIRVALGLVEAPFFPGALFILSCWYTQRELAFRTAILFSGNIIATSFSGLLAAAVFANLDGTRGLAGWQWLFIIEGAGSFAMAFIAMAFLPDFVGSKTGVCAWLMSEKELLVAAQRIKEDRVSLPDENASVRHGLGLAVKDPRTWIFAGMQAFYVTSMGFNGFFPSIVQGLHFGSQTTTLLLTAPPYLLAAATSLVVCMSSDKRADRGLHVIGPVGVAMVGFIITAATTNHAARYFASFLYIPGAMSSMALIFSWSSTAMSETPEKRAAGMAIVCLTCQLGGVWSPYFFRPEDNPRYLLAFILMLVFSALVIATAVLMRRLLGRANQRLIAEAEGTGKSPRLYIL
ncbi:major facilitator superfamily transporter [Colletotrichum navitas]|uniref:Major facilitator superfamily transporter n=1 Tax=Colletotrichum navitas TaxID=681940 RepID=A0AAD8PKB4_9PEZI|nr:major facilitator superfamily transporter [Colletotrichum navitas]KAK1566368.1 major facilitator superfamily transporter [Colletotrichum navitas]